MSTPEPGPRAGSGSTPGRSGPPDARAVRRAVGVLGALVPLARRVVAGVRIGAVAVAVSGAVLALTGWLLVRPTTTTPWLALAVVLVAAEVPAVLLWLFAGALDEVLGLPARLRELPGLARDTSDELAGLARAAVDDQRRSRGPAVLRGGWRAGRLLWRTSSELGVVDPAMKLVNPAFLVAVAVSAAVGLVQIGLALLAIVVIVPVVLVAT